jgi:phage-related protein
VTPEHLWVRFPFELDALSQTSKGEIPQLIVKVANATRVLDPYLEQGGGGIGATVRLVVVHSDHLDETTPWLDETFDVVATAVDATWVTFTLGAPNPFLSRFPRHKYLRDHCRWVFKSAECGYTGGDASCARNLAACRAKSNQLRFGGFPGIPGSGVYRATGGGQL